MNHYRWNILNNVNDMVFVVSVETKEVVLKNNVFEELVHGILPEQSLTLASLMPKKEDRADLLAEVVAYLSAGATAPYCQKLQQTVMGKTMEIELVADYFDKPRNEIYFILKGYRSILQFVRFQKAIAIIPENIVVLALDEALSLYGVNQAFEKNFGAKHASFAVHFGASLANAIPKADRAHMVAQIRERIASGQTYTGITQLDTVTGKLHYVSITANRIDDLLGSAMVCATVQIVDENVERYLHLQKEHEVYSVASNFSKSVLFRFDIADLTGVFYGEQVDFYQLGDIKGNVVQEILTRGLVYHEDIEVFHGMVEDMQKGIERPVRLRMCLQKDTNDWYMIEYKIIKDANGKAAQALGRITNVQKNEELEEKASLDLLTACLNKGTFEAKCMNLLAGGGGNISHAFLIVDIDNFKAVNDNLGHFFGDIVLKEIATKLKRIFRETDYIARIGGDEFAVLMKDIRDYDIICRKAADIIHAVDMTYHGDNASYRISASVGIAVYPTQAETYEDLYKRADIALYYAKNTGKNAYKVYDDTLVQGTMANTTPFDVAQRAFSHFFDQQVALDTFNLLFESTNQKDMVDLVLRHLGERFGVDRCYIFEATSDACTTYQNTYEWCSDGVQPEKDNLQAVPYEHFNEVFAQANAEGVFYCDDVSALATPNAREILMAQGIVSLLHTYVKYGERERYVLGFDDCTAKRMWKPSEISTLMYASKIIAQYLRYAEALKRVDASAREQLAVMDNLNFYAYIIENDTHKIRYYNNVTKQLIPEVEKDAICYKTLRGNAQECHDCPLKTLREKNASKTRTLIHNEKMDIEVLVTASALDSFEGKACTFISSTDVSDIVKATQTKDNTPFHYPDYLVFE